jgi:hypothetical protein
MKKWISQWAGDIPRECDFCKNAIKKQFIDGATIQGTWAIMCVPCHKRYGLGLGIGKGQLYRKTK